MNKAAVVSNSMLSSGYYCEWPWFDILLSHVYFFMNCIPSMVLLESAKENVATYFPQPQVQAQRVLLQLGLLSHFWKGKLLKRIVCLQTVKCTKQDLQ
jgi:hypothetical protein